MNKAITIFSISICVLAISCNSNQKAKAPLPVANAQIPASADSIEINRLLKTDTLIDFDVKNALINTERPTTSEDAKMKVATYRFFKHVKLIDGKYVYQGKGGGKAINLSDRVFTVFTKNLDQINKVSSDELAKGNKVEMPEVTDEYLNSLLQ